MEDKLAVSLDDLIKKDREEKKAEKKKGKQGKKGPNRNQKMKQKFGKGRVPDARAKAQQLRREKVNRFGARDDTRGTVRNGRKFISASKALREAQGRGSRIDSTEEQKAPSSSSRFKVMNLNNSISNEDLNVLFRNIGPLKE